MKIELPLKTLYSIYGLMACQNSYWLRIDCSSIYCFSKCWQYTGWSKKVRTSLCRRVT